MTEEKWYFKWWTVMVLLLAVGPFGFPFLWKSKDFSLFWKIFLTLIFTVITVLAVWGSWATVDLTIKKFKELGLL